MSSAHTLPLALDRCFREGFWNSPDPGASGTIQIVNKAFAICSVRTAGAESRALPPAGGFGVGTRLLVIGEVLVGTATITGSLDGSSVLTTAGDIAEFIVVTTDAAGTKVWKSTVLP